MKDQVENLTWLKEINAKYKQETEKKTYLQARKSIQYHTEKSGFVMRITVNTVKGE